MFLVAIPLPYFLIGASILLIITLVILLTIKENKRKKEFVTKVMLKLMKEKMEEVEYKKNSKIYDFSFKYGERNFYLKIHQGGNKKGFVMTNSSTIHELTYSSNYGPSKNSEVCNTLIPFLVEPLKGIKIILIKNNMLRINKYINENEIVEVKYNEPAFNVYLVQEKDLEAYLELVKRKKK